MNVPSPKRAILYSAAIGAALSVLLLLLFFCEDALTDRGHDWAHILDFAERLQYPGWLVAYYGFDLHADWQHHDKPQFYITGFLVNALVYSLVAFVGYLLAYVLWRRNEFTSSK